LAWSKAKSHTGRLKTEQILDEMQKMVNDGVFPLGYAFCLIYNGKVLTSNMDGCDSDLCDSRVLVERVGITFKVDFDATSSKQYLLDPNASGSVQTVGVDKQGKICMIMKISNTKSNIN
jgi:hypothetical protein